MRKLILAAATIAALAVPAVSMADVTNNPTTNDCHGYATANAVVNIVKEGQQPGNSFDQRGIGQFRSQQTGASVSADSGQKGCAAHPDWVTDQGAFGTISNG